ncbi:signal transduction histidine kinase [Marmoricola sp. URHA0025 HA25]
MGRFAALSMLALVILGFGSFAVSQDIAEAEARRDAEARATGIANGTAAPLVNAAVRAGTPGAAATLGLVLRNRIAEGSVRHVKLWAADGTVIWADHTALVGLRFEQPPAVRALFGTHDTTVELSELGEPENVAEAGEAPLLEVYVGAVDADGVAFVFETYTSPARIQRDRTEVLRRLIPLGFGILLVFEAAVLALAYLLARSVDRAERRRSEIVVRAVASWQLERRRLAQDLHDGVIQDIAAVSYALPGVLEGLSDDSPGAAKRDTGNRLGVLLREDLVALRSLVTDLSPGDLSAVGLRAAITDLFARVIGVDVELELAGDLELDPEVAGLVYRLVREALRNVDRHAAASRAWVRVERRGDVVLVSVSDDGRGFGTGPDPLVPHNGIKLLAEFLKDVGGSVTLEERTGGGAVVVGRVPTGIGPQI